MSECRSFSSNYRFGSLSRKISIGILVDSKDTVDAAMPKEENSTPDRGHCAKGHNGYTSVSETDVSVPRKDSPACCKPKTSDEQIPNFLASSRSQSRLNILKKESAANSAKHSTGKSDLEYDECRQKRFGRTSTHFMDAGKVSNEEPAKSIAPSNEAGGLGNDRVQNEARETETAGHEALRKNLWKILGDISPNRQCSNPQTSIFHSSEDVHRKQSPVIERNQNSDKIESDSEKQTFGRPLTRSLTTKKGLAKNQRNKVGAKGRVSLTRSLWPASHKEGFPQKRVLSFKEDCSGRLYNNSYDGSLNSKRNKVEKQSSALQTHHGHEKETKGEMQQSVPVVEKSLFHSSKPINASSAFDKKYHVSGEPNDGMEKACSIEALHSVMEQQKDVEQLIDVDFPKSKDQLNNSLLRYRGISEQDPLIHNLKTKSPERSPSKVGMFDGQSRDPSTHNFKTKSLACSPKTNLGMFDGHGQDPLIHNFKTKSPECSPKSKPGMLDGHSQGPLVHNFKTKSPECAPKSKRGMFDGRSPIKNIFITKGIRSFKSLLSSKSTEGKANDQLELSDGECELYESLPIKPAHIMEDNTENQMSKSLTNSMDTESVEDDSDMKDDSESAELFSSEMTGCIPESKLFKGRTQDDCELQMYLEDNHEDGLARAVALFNVALCHIKMKLKSMSNKRSAEILWAAADEIFLLFQNAESQMKTDVGKLTNLSQSKRKQLENRFKEHQEQLLGMCNRFKDEVDQHLKDYNVVIEEAKENAVELKRALEKQRAAHKMLISQVEQEIKVKLEDAESRIMAVQELAKEKMLQLKCLVAESVKLT